MTTFSAEEPGIESELLDLSTVPFAALRDLNGRALLGSVRHVVVRAGQVRVAARSSGSSGGERID